MDSADDLPGAPLAARTRPGFAPLPIRWVLVRDPAGKYEATAFLCTDLTADPLQILDWFILKWIKSSYS